MNFKFFVKFLDRNPFSYLTAKTMQVSLVLFFFFHNFLPKQVVQLKNRSIQIHNKHAGAINKVSIVLAFS